MENFFVTKRHEENEDNVFYLERIKNRNREDITADFDTSIRFEDDNQLIEFLSIIYEIAQEDIKITEEEPVNELSNIQGNIEENIPGINH